MKKLIVFILFLLCLSMTAFVKIDKNPLFSIEGVEKVCFVSNIQYEDEKVDAVKCGNKFFNFCSMEVAKQNLEEFKKIGLDGIQFYLTDVSLQEIKNKIHFSEISRLQIGEMEVICGYSPYYQDSIIIDNKKSNVQIAVQDGQIVAGFPIILTGY